MKNFRQKSTERTPEIIGDVQQGTLSIIGRSYMEDAHNFFNPLRIWLKDFYLTESDTIRVVIDIEYMNTSSGMILVYMLKELQTLSLAKDVHVSWVYDADDLDMKEVGEDFQFFIGDIITLDAKYRLAS